MKWKKMAIPCSAIGFSCSTELQAAERRSVKRWFYSFYKKPEMTVCVLSSLVFSVTASIGFFPLILISNPYFLILTFIGTLIPYP